MLSPARDIRSCAQALPICRGDNGVAKNGQLEQAALYLEGVPLDAQIACSYDMFVLDDQLCLKLRSRKNKPEGSLLKRGCWSCSHFSYVPCLVGFSVGTGAGHLEP